MSDIHIDSGSRTGKMRGLVASIAALAVLACLPPFINIYFVGVLTSVLIFAMSMMSGASAFIAMSAILGFVMFAIRPVIHSWTLDLAPAGMSGSAISLLFGTQSAMTMLVPIAGGLIADSFGLAAVFYILTATVSIAALMSFTIPESKTT